MSRGHRARGTNGSSLPGLPERDCVVTEARPGTVGELAEVYLGNILFALERTALALDEETRHDDAAFYRGIARALAEARGKAVRAPK